MKVAWLAAQLVTAMVSHHVTVRFDDARAAHVHEELSYEAGQGDGGGRVLKPLVRELEPVMTVARRAGRPDLVHLVADGVLHDQTGLGLTLDVLLCSEREHQVRVVVEWPGYLDLHWRAPGRVTPTVGAASARRVLSFDDVVGHGCGQAASPDDEVPRLGLSAVSSWAAIAEALRDGPAALPEQVRQEAATARARDPVEWVSGWLRARAPPQSYQAPGAARRTLVQALAAEAMTGAERLRLAAALLQAMGVPAGIAYASAPPSVRLDPAVPDARLEPTLVLAGRWVDPGAPHRPPLRRWQQGLWVFTVHPEHFSFDQLEVSAATLRVDSVVTLGESCVVRERQRRTGFLYLPDFEAWLPAVAKSVLGAEELSEVRVNASGKALEASYTAMGALGCSARQVEVPLSQWLTVSARQTVREIFAPGAGPITIVPLQLEQVTRVELPHGLQLLQLSSAQSASPAVAWEQRVEVGSGDVTVTRRLRFYGPRLDDLEAARRVLEQWAELPAAARAVRAHRD